MNNQPTLDQSNLNYFEWAVYNVLLYLLFIGTCGPVTSIAAFVFERFAVRRKTYALFLSGSFFWLLVVSRSFSFSQIEILEFWRYSIPLFPVASLLLKGAYMFSQFSKPKSLHEKLAEEEERLRLENERRADYAARLTEENVGEGYLMVGAQIKGDIIPPYVQIHQVNQRVYFEESILDHHIFLLGTTGAGKSETIKRLVSEVLTKTDRNIYFVDGKGDEQLAMDIRSLAHHYGRGNAPIFRLGFNTYGAIYNGFRGTAETIYNRLCALVGVSEAEGDAQYYADLNRDLLQLICYAPGGPPRNFEQVRARLKQGWLLNAYKDNPIELQDIDELEDKDIQGLSRRIRPLARVFYPCVGDDGFALEDTRCAIFSMRVQSVGDTARRFLDFLVEDLKDFVGKRQKQPSVLIIDEFGQFSNNNIISLLTLARSAKMGVILATQDTASLKDETTKKNVLANCRTKILMASDFPEEIAELAGTRYQLESSIQHEDGELTGSGSARIQHAFKIDMNEAAKLRAGEAFVIRQRHAIKVKVKAIGEVVQADPQPEEKRRIESKKAKKEEPPKL